MSGEASKKVIVAMSGGVDSSVAAAMLLAAGYDVTGVFLCLGAAGEADGDSRGCCTPQDAADARRVAESLGIDLFVLNLAGPFEEIIEYFVGEYARGRTPNPCIRCNSAIKFGRLIRQADAIGAEYVATGHHARIVGEAWGPAIARGRARDKDQSYALFSIAPEYLGRILLPVGEVAGKDRIRRIARGLGLNVHDKQDSQEICFAEDYVDLLRRRVPDALRGGEIVNSAGDVLGHHDGYGGFTIGQRRGVGVAAGVPMYVTQIDPVTASVTIGPREELIARRLTAADAIWQGPVKETFEATVQIRYNHAGAPGRVRMTGKATFEVDFHEDVIAVTPGQAAVVYDGARLVGGGWIERSGRE